MIHSVILEKKKLIVLQLDEAQDFGRDVALCKSSYSGKINRHTKLSIFDKPSIEHNAHVVVYTLTVPHEL